MSMSQDVLRAVIRVAIACAGTYLSFRMMMSYLDPHREQKGKSEKRLKELMKLLDLPENLDLDDYEIQMASMLVPATHNVSWKDVGGCEQIIQELQERLVFPLEVQKRNPNVSSLFTPAKGILLHGPPGCGKTLIARILAESVDARFIELDISRLTDKYYGESNKFVSALFSLARKLQPTIIFIDEIDVFLRERNMMDYEATSMMKAQFMTFWDGFASSDDRVIIVGATNSMNSIDKAILRRMPLKFFIPKPDCAARAAILKITLGDQDCSSFNFEKVAKYAEGLSGSDLKEVCRTTVIRQYSNNYKETGGDLDANITISEIELLKSILEYLSYPPQTIASCIESYNQDAEWPKLNQFVELDYD